MSSKLHIAIAHHWLVGMRGGEKVLEQICQVLPQSPIYTLVAQPAKLSSILREHSIHTSWLQHLPTGAKHYKKLLPLFPLAVSSLQVKTPVDLVVSSDASVIKGLHYPPGTPHICYCHSPPRYLWDLQEDYTKSSEVGGRLGRALFDHVVPYVREFDLKAAERVTHFIANSNFVRDRIFNWYGRKSEVIHPPVYLDEFEISPRPPEDFYLVVSQLVPYKRIDLAISAFNNSKRKLVIIGEGSEQLRLEKMAGPNITFLGSQPQSVLRDYYSRCRALIFPGIEDFGITPLEAQASGRPVLAYRAGGVLETIIENQTGLFFDEQTPESLLEALERFEKIQDDFDPADCRSNADRFSADHFRENFRAYLAKLSFKVGGNFRAIGPKSAPPMRILLVLEPGIDGVFRYVELLTKYLIGNGHEIHLAYSDRRGSTSLTDLVAYVHLHGGECFNLRVSNGPEPGDIGALAGLRRLAARVRPEIIHCHSSKAGALGRSLRALGVDAKYLYHPHAYYGLNGKTGIRASLYNGVESLLGGIGRTVNISEDERTFAIQRLKIPVERCVVINNPVNASNFVPATPEKRRQVRKSLGLPPDALILGSIGRLAFQKDPETLYRAVAAAYRKGIEFHLAHVGKGELSDLLTAMASKLQVEHRIIRIPYLERPVDFYAGIDALIMTSRYEAFWPLVVLEAMACDLPIICGTGPGTSDIGRSGLSHCWTAPVEDSQAFSVAIGEWYRDIESHRPINHRAIAIDRFSEERSFGELLKLYRSDF